MNYRMISRMLGMALLTEAVLMIPSLIIALCHEESILGFSAAICCMVALGLAGLSRKPENTDIYAREGFGDDCYEEFAYAMQIPEMCDLCRELVVCSDYEVDGMVWIICDDCYGEFAYANNVLSYCSQCAEEKICGHYMVDDLPYSVCDDCYAAFAEANGLPQH